MTRRTLGLGAVGAAAAGLGARLFGSSSEAKDAHVYPVSHSDAEWKKRLTPEQYHVLREHGTERAGTSPLDREKRARHLQLRRLRPAAVLLGHEVRQRHRLAELLPAARGRGRHDGGQQLVHDAAPRCIARAAAAISATSSTTGRSRPACATA